MHKIVHIKTKNPFLLHAISSQDVDDNSSPQLPVFIAVSKPCHLLHLFVLVRCFVLFFHEYKILNYVHPTNSCSLLLVANSSFLVSLLQNQSINLKFRVMFFNSLARSRFQYGCHHDAQPVQKYLSLEYKPLSQIND